MEPCSCWNEDGYGYLRKRVCNEDEAQRQKDEGFTNCGFVEGGVSRATAADTLERIRRQREESSKHRHDDWESESGKVLTLAIQGTRR